jgi:hypothetical protein
MHSPVSLYLESRLYVHYSSIAWDKGIDLARDRHKVQPFCNLELSELLKYEIEQKAT